MKFIQANKNTRLAQNLFESYPKAMKIFNKITLMKQLSFGVSLSTIGGLAMMTAVSATPARADEAGGDVNVAASIRPIHGLVQMVLGETGQAELMMEGTQSPHGGSMRPSERRALATADLVFIIDPSFETGYRKALPEGERLVVLSKADGLTLLERRVDTLFAHSHDEHDHDDEHDEHEEHAHHEEEHDEHAHDEHDHDEHEEHAHHEEEHDEHDHDEHEEHAHHEEEHDHDHDHHDHHDHGDEFYDLHLWLDPYNAIAMIGMIEERLVARYPAHAAKFAENADQARARLSRLDDELAALLKPVQGRGFITHHDAYYYLEKAYDMTSKASIYNHHDTSASVGRLRALRHIVEEEDVICLFHEPQYTDNVLHVIDPDNTLKRVELDPLSADLDTGADFYEKKMRRLAERMAACLKS